MSIFSNVKNMLASSQLGANPIKPSFTTSGIADQTPQLAGSNATQAIQQGLMNASQTLSPEIDKSQQYSDELQNLLMGKTDISQIPGYEMMLSARGDALEDLSTTRAGMGKFFSGTTGEQAAEIGGELANRLMQQRIQNLTGGASTGHNMASQLAQMQMGAGTSKAAIPLQIQQMIMQQQQFDEQMKEEAAANEAGFFGDIIGAGAGVLGAWLGASDISLKENIKKVGRKGEYNWYQWNYKGDDKVYEGVMAHEVAEINPDAVSEQDGYLVVDYARL